MKYLTFILSLLPFVCLSQDLHIKNTSLNLSNGVVLAVNRSLVNRGQVNNEGSLQVSGNWVNAGAYQAEEGQLIFNGNDLQFISQGELPIPNLTLINGRKHISENCYVTGRLELDHTLVFVPGGSAIHLDESATLNYQPGDRIIGALFMTGQDLTFPVGTPERCLPIRLQLPEDQVLEIGVAVKPGLLSPSVDKSISGIAGYYWELLTPETYTGAGVTLNFQDAEFLQNIENARVGEAGFVNDLIKDAGGLFSGSPDAGTVSAIRARGPYFTVARKHRQGEKPPVNVLNLVSPNNDGLNDFLMIENIEAYPGNLVSIFDRWGSKLYEVRSYDNNSIRFDGVGNDRFKSEFEQGSYFYVIDFEGETLATGFFELVR